jgi:hypothetical protein
MKEAKKQRNGGGFARPVGPEDGNRLAPADLETQMVESDPVAVGADDVVETQGRFPLDPLASEATDAWPGW